MFGQPALDYHLPTSLSFQSGWQDSNLRLRAPNDHRFAAVPGGFAATLHPVVRVRTGGFEPPISWSPTLLRGYPGAITRLRHVLFSSGLYGSRTRLPGLKGRNP